MRNYLCLIVVLATLTVACEKKSANEIDFGTIQNSVYHNDYLGFSITIPTNWTIQDQEAQRRLARVGMSAVAGDDKNLKASMKAAEMHSVNLYGAFKYPPGSPVTNNPAMMAVAESVRELPGIKRGKDYLFQVKQLLQSGQIEISFPKDVYSEQVGGVEFDVLDIEMTVGPRTVKEKYYATIRKGYALSLVFIGAADPDDRFEQNAIDTVTFK